MLSQRLTQNTQCDRIADSLAHQPNHLKRPGSNLDSAQLQRSKIVTDSMDATAICGVVTVQSSSVIDGALLRGLGVTALRDGQDLMMDFLRQDKDLHSLIVLPTGSGKTKVVILDAVMRRVCNIIFVPFKAIADDLVDLGRLGECSKFNVVSWESIRHGYQLSVLNAHVVVASFEHAVQEIVPFVQCLHRQGRLGFCFVDEVDVILHTFRGFSQFWSLPASCPLVRIKAMTATLRPSDKVRVEKMIGVGLESEIRRSCRRNDVVLSNRFFVSHDALLKGLIGCLQSIPSSAKTLIFCMTVKEAELLGQQLLAIFPEQVSVSHSRRRDNLKRFAVVTSCFGHGVNVPGLTHILIVRSVWSVEGFIQASIRKRKLVLSHMYGRCGLHNMCAAFLRCFTPSRLWADCVSQALAPYFRPWLISGGLCRPMKTLLQLKWPDWYFPTGMRNVFTRA
jgi:superfamily II DNA helicase RecQ